MITRFVSAAFAAIALPAAAAAQDVPDAAPPQVDAGVFGGDFLSVGVGGALSPSYTGSDDYVISVLPVVLGNFGGVEISPRAGGLKLDFIPDPREGMGFDAGIAARLRSNRASQIEDPIVERYGELDRAIEVGPSVGVNFPAVLNPYDSVSLSTDVMFDVNGAHGGTVVTPSVAYTTPLSRSILANLSVSAEWGSEAFQDYYFAVPAINTLLPDEDVLPAYEPDGGGFTSAGVNVLLGVDLDGDVTNGGLGVILLGGYSRLLGDAADTPFTTIRGSRDQFLGAVGVTYTFGL
ncbi:MAG: MipA/OmpV family protein [Alteraurantiacibacter sp.]